MAITLTDKAAKHVQRNLDKRGKGCGLRLGVRTTGCSGLAYQLEYVDEAAPEDAKFESDATMRVINVPHIHPWLAPILYTFPLQLLSYYVAIIKGTDVDQPRNLAKSVTVE